MNESMFDRRMESAIGLLDTTRDGIRTIAVFFGFTIISIIYWGVSIHEPGLRTNLIETYCTHQAIFGCFNIRTIVGINGLSIKYFLLPWGFFVRQLLLFPMGIIAYFLSWVLRALHWWKPYWILMFLFMLSYLNLLAVLGEGLFDAALINFFWRDVFAWFNLAFMLFVLTLALWNRKLLEKLSVFQSIALLAGGLGGGGIALGVLMGKLFNLNVSGISIMIIPGLFLNFLLVLVSGLRFSQLLWNASPWRLEAEIRAKENGEDPEKWAKIKKLIF